MAHSDQPGFGPDLASFDWEDPFLLKDQLDEDERMLSEAAHVFAQENFCRV